MVRLFACMALVALAGCGGADATPGPADAGDNPPVCRSNFSVDVRSGPSAGLHLEGQLASVVGRDGRLVGVLTPSESANNLAQMTRMTGTVRDGRVTMTFVTPDGRRVTGTGPWPAGASTCAAGTRVVGDATGPAAGDRGDWAGELVQALCFFSDCIGLARQGVSAAAYYACFAACSYAGRSDSNCDMSCR